MSKLILLYVLGVPSGFILYLLGFKIGLFSAEDIIFYRGLKILIATLFIQWAMFSLVIFYFGKSNINIANALAVTMASFAINVTFLVIIPVTLDRSVSVFMLGYMNKVEHPIKRDELLSALQRIYIEKYEAVDRRVDEQIKSGNLILDERGDIVLTSRGKSFISASKKIANLLDIDKKFIEPQD